LPEKVSKAWPARKEKSRGVCGGEGKNLGGESNQQSPLLNPNRGGREVEAAGGKSLKAEEKRRGERGRGNCWEKLIPFGVRPWKKMTMQETRKKKAAWGVREKEFKRFAVVGRAKVQWAGKKKG